MADLFDIIPNFTFYNSNGVPDSELLASLLERLSPLFLADILALPILDLARQAGTKPAQIQHLINQVSNRLRQDVIPQNLSSQDSGIVTATTPGTDTTSSFYSLPPAVNTTRFISTMDPTLDKALGGGFPTGQITEIVGESAAGKTQFLLTLLLAVQCPSEHGGLGRGAVYVSTEDALPSSRLAQIENKLRSKIPNLSIGMDRVYYYHVTDLEYQSHVFQSQLPILMERLDVGLVVLDSIAGNLRTFFQDEKDKASSHPTGVAAPTSSRSRTLGARRFHLVRIGAQLRELAIRHNAAVVVANQVLDRFDREITFQAIDPSSPSSSFSSQNPSPNLLRTVAHPLTLNHQLRWFSGWGSKHPFLEDDPTFSSAFSPLKTPTLGLVWAVQLGARVALTRTRRPRTAEEPMTDPEFDDPLITERHLKVIYASWASPGGDDDDSMQAARGTKFEIYDGGVRGVLS